MKLNLHSQVHEWRDRKEDGRLRIVRAQWDTKKWSFTDTYKDLPTWQAVPKPPLEDYEMLRDVLWRKYQRKRVPFRFLEEIDALIAEMKSGAA